MDQERLRQVAEPTTQDRHLHRKSSGQSLLSRIPFIRSTLDTVSASSLDGNHDDDSGPQSGSATHSIATATSQQVRTRRRKGSLRKVALLGRGAQRDKRDSSPLVIDTSYASQMGSVSNQATPKAFKDHDALGLTVSDLTPRASDAGYAQQPPPSNTSDNHMSSSTVRTERHSQGPTPTYNSTTDEEDMLQISHVPVPMRPVLPMTSGSESYFGNIGSAPRRRSFQQAKSPLSYSGLSSTPLPPSTAEWDYTETEWWGWVVLTVTWFVFVTGMGSCLGVWSWAWDVGKTPYAPPELEDDPTLPIVGYYPALIILTCVMAWVWVVVAWVGMKYFRHAKISGD